MSPLRSITVAISLQLSGSCPPCSTNPAKSEVHAKVRLFARNGENGQRPVRVSLRMKDPNRELLQLHTCRSPDEPEYFGCRNRCARDKAPLLSPGFVMTTTMRSHAVSA